uniref:Uncharacterized protein n=1 Tax=Opuntia streptacantha TaxID=393608 RepID=A0A7C9AU60_OPUST
MTACTVSKGCCSNSLSLFFGYPITNTSRQQAAGKSKLSRRAREFLASPPDFVKLSNSTHIDIILVFQNHTVGAGREGNLFNFYWVGTYLSGPHPHGRPSP